MCKTPVSHNGDSYQFDILFDVCSRFPEVKKTGVHSLPQLVIFASEQVCYLVSCQNFLVVKCSLLTS